MMIAGGATAAVLRRKAVGDDAPGLAEIASCGFGSGAKLQPPGAAARFRFNAKTPRCKDAKMVEPSPEHDLLARQIVDAAFAVHTALGPGLPGAGL
jgi:hypothetical protein